MLCGNINTGLLSPWIDPPATRPPGVSKRNACCHDPVRQLGGTVPVPVLSRCGLPAGRPAPGTGGAGVVVTIEVADDAATAFLGPGQHVTLWNGGDIGHGVISRRVFFTTAP
jgi:hypothetical protein